jgi:A1 cistron-splicing factor AAR2
VLGEAASQFEVRENEKNIEQTYPILIPHNFQGDAASTIAPPAPPPKDQPRRGSVPDPDFAADSILIWRHLTSAINPSFLSRVTGKKTVTEWLVDTTDGAKGDIHFPGANKLLKSIVGSQLDFLFQQDIIDLQTLNIAAGDQSGTDTTSRIIAALNSSKHDSSPNPGSSTSSSPSTPAVTESDILAELQFAFLTGLHLGNYTCIEQWWHLLLKIILRAHQLVLSRPELTRSLLQTFHAQMIYNDRYIDHAAAANNPSNDTNPYRTAASAAGKDGSGSTNSVLETIPRNKAKLREALTIYKRRLNASLLGERNNISPEQGAVGHAFADLEAWFWRYGWDLRSDYVQGRGDEKEAGPGPVASSERMVLSDSDSDEGGEYAPVVVQLDENGREVGLVNLSGE